MLVVGRDRNEMKWSLVYPIYLINDFCNIIATIDPARWLPVAWCLFDALGPFYQYGLTLIPAWISNYIYNKVWDEITYQFLNFNGATD